MYPQYGPPPPAYYPPPQPVMYMASVPMAPRATQEGIKYMSYYILVGIITSLIGFFLALLAIISPATVIGLSCVVGGLGLLLIILFIVAMIKIWEGKMEFGPQHENNIKMAVYMFIAIIVLTCITMAVSFVMAFSMMISGNINAGLAMILVVSSVIGIITSILWGLIELNIVKHFTTPDEMTRGYTAILLMVVGQVVSMAITFYLLSTTNMITSNTTSYTSYIGGVITIFGNLLFYGIYKAVLTRFMTGLIKPLPPPGMPLMQPPMGPVYGPPGYPPQGPPPPVYPI